MAQKVSPRVLYKVGEPLMRNGGFSSKFVTFDKKTSFSYQWKEGSRSLLLTRIGHFLKKTYRK